MKRTFLRFMLACCLPLAAAPFQSDAQNITTVAGCGIGDDSLGIHAEIGSPVAITFDASGNAYIADNENYRVRKVSTSGIITTIAGNGAYGYSGDGGPATAASLGSTYGVALDRMNNIYITDADNNCIRKISPSGTITTIAGTGTAGYSGDGGPATAAMISTPIDVITDTIGNVYFTDWYNTRVRKINTAGIISTVVGDGMPGTSGNGGPATAAELGQPFRITFDNKGNLYIAETYYQHICKVDTAGIITIIGDTTGAYGTGTDGDGGLAIHDTMTAPCGIAVDTSGHLYFSDISNQRIRMINLNSGIVSDYAANGYQGYSGDGGMATMAKINVPEGLGLDAAGNLYICDAQNNRVRQVNTATGIISTFAGQNALFEDGYPAVNAELELPGNLACDTSGNIYIADNINNRVSKVNVATGIITTVAGNGIGTADYGDGGPATAACSSYPQSVAVDNAGNIYIAETYNARVRKVDTAGTISTFAGSGISGFSRDGGPADTTELNYPSGLATDRYGNVYIADYLNCRIRKVNNSGIISTVAGTGSRGYTGDGGPATAASLAYPIDVSLDYAGNIYIVDQGNDCIRRVDTSGIITTIAGGGGAAGFSGDGGPATAARFSGPAAVKADSAGDIYIADAANQRIRMIDKNGVIRTIAGNGTEGFSGDGGPATAAMLNTPEGLALDKNGNVYIADAENFRIRKVNVNNILSVTPVQSSNNNVSVYPNPAHGQITIVSQNLNPAQAVLTNALGQQVLTTLIVAQRQSMELDNLPNGIYMLEITDNTGNKTTVKIIKD